MKVSTKIFPLSHKKLFSKICILPSVNISHKRTAKDQTSLFVLNLFSIIDSGAIQCTGKVPNPPL